MKSTSSSYIASGAVQGVLEYFDGVIEDLRIFSSYLSADDIYAIFLEGTQFYPYTDLLNNYISNTGNRIRVYPNPLEYKIIFEYPINVTSSGKIVYSKDLEIYINGNYRIKIENIDNGNFGY